MIKNNILNKIPERQPSELKSESGISKKRQLGVRGPGYTFGGPGLSLEFLGHSNEIDVMYIGIVLSPTAEAQLIKHYPKLTQSFYQPQLTLYMNELSEEERVDLMTDFFLNFSQADQKSNGLEELGIRLQDIDDRNFCSHLTNFVPQSDSQTKALKLANRFLEFKELQPAIFFLEGEGGRGKTHLALGMAKKYLQEGKKVYFLSGLQHRLPTAFDKSKMKEADVIVLDDLNACDGVEDIVKEIVRDCHEQSKRLIITSNVSPRSIIDQLYPPGKDHEKEGFKDRFESALVYQQITTQESYRNKGLQNMQRFFALGEEDS